MTVQFIEIAGQRMAILSVADYDRLLDAAEDRADESAASAAQERRDNGEEYVSAVVVDRILHGENALRAWREYRNLTQLELAAKAGITASAISKAESGQQRPRPSTLQALAAALNVTPVDIMPVS